MAEWGKSTQMLNDDELAHHGILGMKWGVRRYQNKDGSLTAAGRKRYGYGEKMDSDESDSSVTKKVKADYNNLSDQEFMNKYHTSKNSYRKRVNKYGDPYMNSPSAKKGKKLAEKQKAKLASDVNRNWAKVYNDAAERSGEVYAKVNAKHNNVDFNDPGKAKENYRYMKDISKAWKDLYMSELSKRYSGYIKEVGTDWMKDVPYMNAYDAETLYWKKIIDAYSKK